MDRRFLLRPEVKVKKKTSKEKVLPADFAAAYASYHSNLIEQKKLEEKLQIIDVETKQMNRNFRQQREVLEKEMKKTESDYWNCHRVFSADTLITESDSYRKRFYTGPQPTKAKLPRRTLERLSELVRSLQAVDDLETLRRFQRCARYAPRKTLPEYHESVSSLTLSQEGSEVFDPWEQQHLTEMPKERSTDKAGRLNSNTSINEKRIRSAPVRVASRTQRLGECKKKQPSAGPRQYAPEKLELDIFKNSAAFFEKSKGMTHTGGKDKASVRFAWKEKEKTDTTVDEGIDTCLSDATAKDSSRDIDLIQASPEHETSHSSEHQPCEVNLVLTSSQCRISRGSSDKISSQQDPQRGESSFVHVQSKEAKISEPDNRDSKCSTTCQDQAYIQSPVVENEKGGDENLKYDSIGAKDAITPNNGRNLIRIAYLDNKSSMPNSCDISKNEDFAHILEEKGKGRDAILLESEGECSFRKHASSHRIDNEAQHLTQCKRGYRNAEVIGNNTHGAALYKYEGAETTNGRRISVALPKSSLHGLSSCQKSLTPRTPLQRNHRASIKAEDKQELRSNFVNLHAKMLPHDADKRPENEKQAKDAHKKKKPSMFKRACLSEALFSEQTQVESQLRNRVQGFLGAIHTLDPTNEKSAGEEEFQ